MNTLLFKSRFLSKALVVLLMSFTCSVHCQLAIAELQVEYQKEPLGIDIATPRFSWRMVTGEDKRGIFQTAYQIEVTDEKGYPSGIRVKWKVIFH